MTNTRSTSSAACRAFTDLLPLLEKPETDAQAREEALTHLATCASCRAQRLLYHQMEQDAYRTLSPAASIQGYHLEELLASIVQELPAPQASTSSSAQRPGTRHRPIRPRRVIAGLAPLAAVLVIVVVAATLFAFHPRPGGTTGTSPATPKGSWSELHALSMVSADEGWAAGFTAPCDRTPINDTTLSKHCQTTTLDPLLLHYQHGTWTTVQVPFKEPITTISMRSATDGWAGGEHLFLHYDGHTWKQMPNPNDVSLGRLHMLSDTDGWALGYIGQTQAILHYDGQTWTAQRLPASIESAAQQEYSFFADLAMISPTEGWAGATLASGAQNAGTSSTPDTNAVILHYMNGQWTVQSSTPHAFLSSISMVSATDGWASGTADTSRPLLVHYTGGKWTEGKTSGNASAGGEISMVDANDGWSTSGGSSGGYAGPSITDLLHYNGQQWMTVPALSIQNQAVNLDGLQMLSAIEGWGVGELTTFSSQHDSNGAALYLSWKAVIVHYHNGVVR